MTLGKLIQKLEKLKTRVGARTQVCIDVDSIRKCVEHSHAPLDDVDANWINICDGDGWTIMNADGQERQRLVVELKG